MVVLMMHRAGMSQGIFGLAQRRASPRDVPTWIAESSPGGVAVVSERVPIVQNSRFEVMLSDNLTVSVKGETTSWRTSN
ncbi:MAG: hypothetical protein ACRD2M_07585 [Terriglobales bacterium]